ncbi:MAG TPA: universal stress protein [Ktedonobacterales bacterium]|nr:universal stress protein [Ktedonobacterales bacterium]
MFQRILVPLDGSPRAEQAIPVAAHLARATGGTLVFIQVTNPYVDYTPYMGVPAPLPQDASADDARAYLRAVALRAATQGVPAITEVVSGSAAEAILAAAHEQHADVIMMSSHGRSGLTRWVLGSVAQKVARHAPVPVLVLRGESHALIEGAAAGATPREVLVPLDGSAFAEAALRPALEMAAALGGPVVVRLLRVISLPVVHTFPGYLPPVEDFTIIAREEVRRDAQNQLATVAERLRGTLPAQSAISIEMSAVFALDVATAIIEIAEGHDETLYHAGGGATLIAMATHGRGGLARWAMGSITERVLQGTSLPTLVVRPQELAQSGAAVATAHDPHTALPRTAPIHPPHQA